MTPRTGHVMLACLVAMVAAAAPSADRTNNQEEAVSLRGDSDSASLGRGKRAKEEIVFGNQQNGAKLPAPAAKKSAKEFHFPPLMPSGLMAGPPQAEGPGSFGPFPQGLEDKMEQSPYQFFGPQAAKQGYQVVPSQEAKSRLLDKSGFMYASEQRPVEADMDVDPIREETLSELPAPATPAPSEKEGEKEKEKESPEPKSPAQSAVSREGEEEPTPESVIGEPEEPSPQKSPEAEESEKGEEGLWENSEALMKLENAAVVPLPSSSSLPEFVESVVPISQGSGPPLDSRLADAEEVLHAKDQTMDKDDMEDFLQDLQESKQVDNQADIQRIGAGEEEGEEEQQIEEAQEKAKEEEKEEEKDLAEAGLMPVMSPDADAAEKSLESGDYTKELLKYILMNSHDYERVPVGVPGYRGYSSYYTRRRRRSLAPHRSLPHIHRRRRSGGRQLSRSKRTKRDLFDDDLYLNPNSEYAFRQAIREEEKAEEEEEEEERQAEMEELISYLMALYPAVYQNQPPPRGSPYPGYMWYGNNYPEEAYPEEEVPEYLQPPFAEWEPPSQSVPAWEPAFYPEEVEEQGYYPAPAKRQSLDRLGGGGGGYQTPDLYPLSQEPSWEAFAPTQEERAYEEAYQRLQDLASVLAEAGQPSPYNLNAYSDYRKK